MATFQTRLTICSGLEDLSHQATGGGIGSVQFCDLRAESLTCGAFFYFVSACQHFAHLRPDCVKKSVACSSVNIVSFYFLYGFRKVSVCLYFIKIVSKTFYVCHSATAAILTFCWA